MKTTHYLDTFLEFEKKNNLFDWKIDNVPIWELIRWKTFNEVDPIADGLFAVKENQTKQLLTGLKFFLLNFFFKNPGGIKRQVDTIFINHARRKFNKDSGFYEDIYTDSFLNSMPPENSYIVLENYFKFNHFTPVNTENLFYLDKLNYIRKFLRIFSKYKLSAGEIFKIKTVERKFNEEFNINISNLEKTIEKEIIVYNYIHKSLKKMFLRLKPNRLIVAVSYDGLTQIACLVAKELNIKVCELQHGTVGQYHIGYNYPEGVNVNFFPDYFFSWGKFWTEKARFPTKSNIIYLGFPYINNQKILFGKTEKKKQILVMSQLSKNIAYFALELSKVTSYKILFKPHPVEYSELETRYDFLQNVENLQILDDPKINIYEYYNSSEYILGVFSTSLIEALSFEAKIIILKFAGWEYFNGLVNENVFFAENLEETLKILSSNKSDSNTFDKNYFFIEKSNEKFVTELLI